MISFFFFFLFYKLWILCWWRRVVRDIEVTPKGINVEIKNLPNIYFVNKNLSIPPYLSLCAIRKLSASLDANYLCFLSSNALPAPPSLTSGCLFRFCCHLSFVFWKKKEKKTSVVSVRMVRYELWICFTWSLRNEACCSCLTHPELDRWKEQKGVDGRYE